MSDIAIRVEGLSKQFRIGSAERYRTLRDSLTDAMSAPFRLLRNGRAAKAPAETIWALKDVSFDVKRGEVIGHHRPQRRGQKHAAEDSLAHHRADARSRRYYTGAWGRYWRWGPASIRN